MEKSIHSAHYNTALSLLRELRQSVGLRQTDLAVRLGRPQSFVSKVESGERRIDITELRDICLALGIGLEQFVAELESRTSSLP